jgi:hypothetical protein
MDRSQNAGYKQWTKNKLKNLPKTQDLFPAFTTTATGGASDARLPRSV